MHRLACRKVSEQARPALAHACRQRHSGRHSDTSHARPSAHTCRPHVQCFQRVRFAYLPIIKEVWADLRPCERAAVPFWSRVCGLGPCHGACWAQRPLASSLRAPLPCSQLSRIPAPPCHSAPLCPAPPDFYFMLLIMWGFATAFYIALRRDQDAQKARPPAARPRSHAAQAAGCSHSELQP